MATTVLIDSPKGLISTVNASTTPLAGGATYTGTGEQNYFPDVMASCYADVAGTLYFDFSIDGTNWRTDPTAGFAVAAATHSFHTSVKGPRYFRVRYINGSGAQATFQLATYYGTFRPTETGTKTATLAAANAEVLTDLNGENTVSYDVRTAAGSLTFIFEGTRDETNYFAIPAFCEWQLLAASASGEQYVSTVTPATTMSGNYTVNCAGMRRVRLRVSAFTSGNIVVAARASAALVHSYSRPIPATLWVTATAAANTNAVVTLPAAGAGLFHYITMISGVRNATAAVLGTATLVHTSTNLPGSPAWSVGNAMVAGGTQVDIDVQTSQPIKSLLANTATTLTMVAGGAMVLNRLNVAYYVGI